MVRREARVRTQLTRSYGFIFDHHQKHRQPASYLYLILENAFSGDANATN